MIGAKVKAENIPKRQREQLAAPLLQIVRAAFENTQIQEEFRQWQEERSLKEAQSNKAADLAG